LPIASFTVSCTELTCQVDGVASSDPDGSVDNYAWDFGDSGTASGVTAEHTYALAGAYTITLTVTDNRAGTGTTTRNINVAPPAAEITFVGSDTSTVNGASATVDVPAAVVSGDALLVSAASNSNTTPLTGPSGSGWTLLQTVTAGTGMTSVWSKVASAGDAGAAVTFSAPTAVKMNVTVLAYHGTSGSNPVSVFGAAAETVNRSTHTTPTVTVPTDGSWVVSLWSDKSSSTTVLSTPTGQTQREHSCGTGPGHVCALVTDGNAPVSAGSAGGLTTTADASSASDSMWTIVLTR
jgi:PKD repeat protein